VARRPRRSGCWSPLAKGLVQVLADIPTPSANIYAVYSSTHNLPRRALVALDYLGKYLPRRIDTDA